MKAQIRQFVDDLLGLIAIIFLIAVIAAGLYLLDEILNGPIYPARTAEPVEMDGARLMSPREMVEP